MATVVPAGTVALLQGLEHFWGLLMSSLSLRVVVGCHEFQNYLPSARFQERMRFLS
jgi:hypothetical protein